MYSKRDWYKLLAFIVDFGGWSLEGVFASDFVFVFVIFRLLLYHFVGKLLS